MDESRTNSKIPFRKSDISLIIFLIIALLIVNAVLNLLFGQSYKKYAKFNINNISTWVSNNGIMDGGNSSSIGLEFPKGTRRSLVFMSGFLWGGKINNEIKVGGSTYNAGLKGGRILENETGEDATLNSVRVYRVRPDYKTGDLTGEANDEGFTVEEIKAKYELDWNEWPAEHGAPFKDLNNNGIYEPSIDIPGVSGAEQTLWFVSNDLDSNITKTSTGSLPIGLEVQVTTWGYSTNDFLNNVVFKKYKLINKSNYNVNDAYICIWTDPDVGDASDDYSGCDTLLNLGFAYNSNDNDATYGSTPPAVGFQFLKGPQNNQGETLNMTAFGNFICGDTVYRDPWLGDYERGSLAWYNWFQGLVGLTGEPMPVPEELGGGSTKFTLLGDPLTGTGWIGGIGNSCGDTKFFMSSGPFTLNANEYQEIIFAEFAAMGDSRLNSVSLLKQYSNSITSFYNSDITSIKKTSIPNKYLLSQNYPNPFNPTTKIKFTIPVVTANFAVTTNTTAAIKIYDILGREVKTLYNGEITEGEHEIDFNSSGLPSGIYFYQLQVNGRIIDSKKMVLLK